MEQVKFHFDPLCPWCYQTSRWARRLEELGEVELEWGVFSLEVVNLDEGKDRHELDARSAPALRTAIMIRDSLGAKAIGPFYAALGRRIWEEPPLPDDPVAAVREALDEAGLDPVCATRPSPTSSPGTPSSPSTTRSSSGPAASACPPSSSTAGPARRSSARWSASSRTTRTPCMLWQHTVGLMRYGNFSELKRARACRPTCRRRPGTGSSGRATAET